jgi:hypothetical protein
MWLCKNLAEYETLILYMFLPHYCKLCIRMWTKYSENNSNVGRSGFKKVLSYMFLMRNTIWLPWNMNFLKVKKSFIIYIPKATYNMADMKHESLKGHNLIFFIFSSIYVPGPEYRWGSWNSRENKRKIYIN